jgi:hypothetical protein
MALDPLTAVLDVGGKLLDKFFPDADADMKNKMNQFLTVFTAQAQIVQAEAASNNWLASSWRPITMLVFVALIVARWFGWAAPNLAEAEYLKLWDIVQLGLGGYVIGRSVEKVIPSIADAIKK